MRGFFLAVMVLAGMADVVGLAQTQESGQAAPSGESQPTDVKGLLNLDIEQLANVAVKTAAPMLNTEVTSVSKQESTVGKSPAAIYVISSEMIHRSACNNIPDLLRLVPGMDVARIDSHSWAITSRGGSDRFATGMLVLIDGRSVYSAIVNGIYWDVQDLLLEDIERIEVIRGPGGTLWGENAVHGVINIITKKAKDTQGALVTYGGGTEDIALGGARVGGVIGEDLHYRIYGKHREEASGFNPAGPANDAWRQGRAGFRADWEPDRDKSNIFTVQGDYYRGSDGLFANVGMPVSPFAQTLIEDEAVDGGNLLARWTHKFDESSDWMLQTYLNQEERVISVWKQNVHTFDVQFQHRFPLRERHEVIWGVEYRQNHDDEACDDFVVGFDPLQRTASIFDVFVQDQIALVEDRFFFIVGSKFGRNDYSGFEYQPSARLLYTPDEKHSWWAAISRAVRTPSRWDQNGALTGLPQPYYPPFYRYFPRLEGNVDTQSEDLLAYEIGYRAQPVKEFSYDLALFYNVYDDSQTFREGQPYIDPYGNLIVPVLYASGMHGEAYGVELSSQWSVSEVWRLSGSYNYLQQRNYLPSGALPIFAGVDPRNHVCLMSSWDLGHHWQFDMIGRYVDSMESPAVPEYLTMDVRLAWRPNKRIEVAVIGRNLFDNHHPEYTESRYPYVSSEVERSVFGNVTWRR